MKRLEIFLLPLDGMVVHRRSLPPKFARFPQQFAGTSLWVERGTVRVKCLALEHITMSPARARTRTARSGVEHTNHEATAPPTKCVKKLAPNYLCNMFTPRTLSFDLRDASQKLYLPKPRTDYLKRSFTSYSRAYVWNYLPEDIRAIKSLRNFKRRIDKWLSVSDSHTANM